MSWLDIWTALWLGILTSISPCPLAANIAAISFIGKDISSHVRIFLSGMFYTLGRVAAYIAIGVLLSAGLSSVPDVANFLQKYMNAVLGPLLLLAGMILFGWIKFNLPDIRAERFQKLADRGGIVAGPFLLGFIFALAFCPVSAALFFGGLIPLAVATKSTFLFPCLYGTGTGLPVMGVAFLLAFGVHSIARFFAGLTRFEKWARYATGVIFVVVGGYYAWGYTFQMM